MSNFILNGWEFYDAPKNAGTTVRMWLKYYEGHLLDFIADAGYYNLKGLGLPKLWRNNVTQEPQFFSSGEAMNQRWCIKRDPVERFVSAYNDKVRNAQLVTWSVDTCLSMLESGEMEQIARVQSNQTLAACHFLSQCFWFGKAKDYYDHVFDIQRMDLVKTFCETFVFKMALPTLHARDQSRSGIEGVGLSGAQRRRVEAIYCDDYAAGWC